MFQDLPRLGKTADRTERYILNVVFKNYVVEIMT
jgi:hypothetical protein